MTNRVFDVYIYQNTGTASVGTYLNLAGKIKDIGNISQSIDQMLTACVPGTTTIKVLDIDQSVFNWFMTNAPIASGTLPPFAVITINGINSFVGIVDLSSVPRDVANAELSLTITDWSNMLTQVQLDPTSQTWQRQAASSTVHTGISTVTVNAGAKTLTRTAGGTGSFILDGFTVGMNVISAGFNNTGNNGIFTITALTTNVMTCSGAIGLVSEVGTSGVDLTHGFIGGCGATVVSNNVPITLQYYGTDNVIYVTTTYTITTNGLEDTAGNFYPVTDGQSVPPCFIIVGDVLAIEGLSGVYPVTSITMPSGLYGTPIYGLVNGISVPVSMSYTWAISLGGTPGFSWTTQFASVNSPTQSGAYSYYYNFYKIGSNITSNAYYTTTATVTANTNNPVYSIPLNTVDGLAIGDTIQSFQVGSSSVFTITDIDSQSNLIYVSTAISSTISSGTNLFLTTDSLNTLVFQSAQRLLTNAAYPFSVDFSKFTPGVLPVPCFQWQGLTAPNATGGSNDLHSPWDVQPGLSNIQVAGFTDAYGNPMGWSGDYYTGWTSAGAYTKYAIWTGQQKTAPTSLMPDYTSQTSTPVYTGSKITGMSPITGLMPYQRQRNRSYITYQYQDQDNPIYLWSTAVSPAQLVLQTDTWTTTVGKSTSGIVVYDYSGMRRLIFSGLSNVNTSSWNGSSYSTSTPHAYPLTYAPISAVPMPGTTSTLGSGSGILVLSSDGTNAYLNLIFSGTTAAQLEIVANPNFFQTGVNIPVLINTQAGIFLVSQGSYGPVSIVSGQLLYNPIQIGPTVAWQGNSFNFLPNTAAVLEADFDTATGQYSAFYMMATVGSYDYSSSALTPIYETHLYHLPVNTAPYLSGGSYFNNANYNPILSDELITKGLPRISMAFTHPDGQRIVGLCGGQLFTISTLVSDCIQRFTPGDFIAMDLITTICQTQNCIAVPDLTKPVLHFISRNDTQTPTAINIQKTASSTSVISPDVYSLVNVTGVNQDLYNASATGESGRLQLAIQSPLLWSTSHCQAMALSYVAFYGQFRQLRSEEWFWDDTTTNPPWESLSLFQCITIPNSSNSWYLMSIARDLNKNRAQVKLLQAL